jgi:hypothetical protein
MSRLLYVDPDEEVTDLVDRIRKSGEEAEVVFVLPPRARIGQSSLNLRLLQQYGRSANKRVAVVSPEPRVQLLAQEAGLPTYVSVQAFERGIEVVGTPALEVVTAGVDDEVEPAVRTGRGRTVRDASEPPSPRLPARSRRRLYITAGALVAVGLLLLFLVAPSATVTVRLAANTVKVSQLIQGTSDPTAAAGPNHVLTKVVTADESQSFQAKPTGTKAIPAAAATGSVVLSTDLAPFGACITGIRKGQTAFTTSGSPPVVFLAAADVTSNSQRPDCHGLYLPPPQGGARYGAPSDPVPVVAQVPGEKGNVPAQAIDQWPQNPCNAPPSGSPDQIQTCSSSDIVVSNPQPTSGGVDAHTVTVVSDADRASFQQQVDGLEKQLSEKVKQDLQAKAPHLTFAVDPTGGGLAITTDVQPPLPNVGDEYQPTTITVSAHGRAAMYNPDDLRKVLDDDLAAAVPKDQQLIANPSPHADQITVTQAGDDGTVIFNATITAYSRPAIDFARLRDRLAGKSRSAAFGVVEEVFGSQVQGVEVSEAFPFSILPVLPLFSSRIDVVVVPQVNAPAAPTT